MSLTQVCFLVPAVQHRALKREQDPDQVSLSKECEGLDALGPDVVVKAPLLEDDKSHVQNARLSVTDSAPLG